MDALLEQHTKVIPVTGRPSEPGDELILDYAGFCTRDLDTPMIDQGCVRQHLEATEKSLSSVPLPGKFEGTVIFTPDCLGQFLYMLASNYIMGGVIMIGYLVFPSAEKGWLCTGAGRDIQSSGQNLCAAKRHGRRSQIAQ